MLNLKKGNIPTNRKEVMQFSFEAFAVIAGLVLLMGGLSYIEGTFTSKTVTMGFVNHGGMWGDLLLMSTAIGFIIPHLKSSSGISLIGLPVALVLTEYAHEQWAKYMRAHYITGHMFPTHTQEEWRRSLSWSGYTHFILMNILLYFLFLYIASPMPKEAIIIVSVLVSAHVILGTVQPGWYCTGKLLTQANLVPPAIGIAAIWTIAAIKLA